MAIYDLFISYSSRDRKWAERFDADIRTSYPQLRVFFDRASIMAGAAWRQAEIGRLIGRSGRRIDPAAASRAAR